MDKLNKLFLFLIIISLFFAVWCNNFYNRLTKLETEIDKIKTHIATIDRTMDEKIFLRCRDGKITWTTKDDIINAMLDFLDASVDEIGNGVETKENGK